jgi:hypothetical protein
VLPNRVRLSSTKKYSTLPSADVLLDPIMVKEVNQAREHELDLNLSGSDDRMRSVGIN